LFKEIYVPLKTPDQAVHFTYSQFTSWRSA